MRAYDPMSDKFVETSVQQALDEASVEEIAALTDPSYVIRETRYQGLLAAIEAAKLGLAHDVYQTADKYARWLAGGDTEVPTQASFQERLKALVDECRRSGEVDDDKVLHDMQVVMGIDTGRRPDRPMPGLKE